MTEEKHMPEDEIIIPTRIPFPLVEMPDFMRGWPKSDPTGAMARQSWEYGTRAQLANDMRAFRDWIAAIPDDWDTAEEFFRFKMVMRDLGISEEI